MNKPMIRKPLAFIDLAKQRARIGQNVDQAIQRVLAHGNYIMGPEVRELEIALSNFCGAQHALTCSNGTDALGLVLMALGLGAKHAVLCPSFTFAATAEAVAWFGATPVFVDIDEQTFNLDPASLEAGIKSAKAQGLTPVGVISVDLFGQPADYERIEPICAAHRLWLLSDAAQSFGATYKGRKVGTIGTATATSFFPAKPLGCYGDGGAVFTDDAELAATIKSLRVHGQGSDKYDNVRIGLNGRLDTLQAAILIEKMRDLPGRNRAPRQDCRSLQRRTSRRRTSAAGDRMAPPRSGPSIHFASRPTRREALAAGLKSRGIPTAIYYAKPLHQQTAYRKYPVAGNGLPVSDRIASEVISLPMHPYLEEGEQDFIIDAVKAELC